jgi:hypothetical protein
VVILDRTGQVIEQILFTIVHDYTPHTETTKETLASNAARAKNV